MIAGSYGICIFSFIRNCQNVFQSGFTLFMPYPSFSKQEFFLWISSLALLASKLAFCKESISVRLFPTMIPNPEAHTSTKPHQKHQPVAYAFQ